MNSTFPSGYAFDPDDELPSDPAGTFRPLIPDSTQQRFPSHPGNSEAVAFDYSQPYEILAHGPAPYDRSASLHPSWQFGKPEETPPIWGHTLTPSRTPSPHPTPTPPPQAHSYPTPSPAPHPTPSPYFIADPEEGRKRQEETLEQIYTKPGFFEEWKKRRDNSEALAAVGNPDKAALIAVNTAFLAREMNRSSEELMPSYGQWRDKYAQIYFDRPAIADEEFFELSGRLFNRRKAQEVAGAELYRNTIAQALEDSVTGQAQGSAPILEAWSRKHSNLLNERNDTAYYQAALRMLGQAEVEIEPFKAPAGRVWDTLTKFTQGRASDRDVLDLARELGGLSREDRKRIFNYAATAAQAREIDPGAFEQVAKNIGQSISRSFDFLGKGSLATSEDTARSHLKSLEEDQVHIEDTKMRRAAGVSTLPMMGPWDESTTGSRPLTPEEKAYWIKHFREILPAYQVAREMKALAREQIDPIKPVAEDGTFWGTVERGTYGAAGSTGLMAVSAVHPVMGAMAYADEEYDRILVENPDLDPGAARMISYAEGAANAAIDKVQLDKIPGVGQFLKSAKGKRWQAAGALGKTWTEQNIQELAQNAIAPITETVASKVRTDMAAKDPREEFAGYAGEIPETLVANTLLIPFGHGVRSLRDLTAPSPDIELDLRMASFSKEQVNRIKSARTPEEFEEIVREQFPRLKQHNIRAREPKSIQNAQSNPANGARAARFLLEVEKGRLLGKLVEINPRTAAGKILTDRLRELDSQIDNLEGQGTRDNGPTGTAAALRFSRRESGESADGTHRLAQPQTSWYESSQDERNDTAATLHSLRGGDVSAASQQRRKPGRGLASYAGLLAWCREHGKILDPSRFANLQSGVAGGEHTVIRATVQPGRLYKLTKPGYFGAQAEDAGKYLQRWALANRVLDDEVRFEGMVTLPGETEARTVISQPEVEGRDATEAEQADYLHSKGFIEDDGRWIHPVLGVAIWDTITPGNVIVRPDGSMQAVDLQIGPAKNDDLRSVRERTGIGRPTAFSKSAARPGDELIRRANETVKITEARAGYPALRPSDALDWLRNPENGIVGEHINHDTGLSWNVSGRSFSKMVKQGIKEGEPAGAHAVRIAASYHLPELIENAKGFEVEDLRADNNISRLYDLFAPFYFNGALYRLRIEGKVSDHQGNKAHSMRVDDIVAEKVPLEGNDNLASKSPRITTATSGEITLRQLFKGVNPYSGSVFSLGKNLPPTEFSSEQIGRHTRQVQSWVGQATALWTNKLPIVVHDSESSIPDSALREHVSAEGDVEGFYSPADGSIHLLADRIPSAKDAERIVRHEGMHLVFNGPLREEYLDLLDRVAKSIPEDRLHDISKRYQNQRPEIWLEEYLAEEGQNASKSPVWRHFVYEIKRLLRRAFGNSVEFSESDIVAFLSKARRTMEGGGRGAPQGKLSQREANFARIQQERGRILGKIETADPASAIAKILQDRLGELNEELADIQPYARPTWNDPSDLRFAKTPKRSSWNEVRNKDKWNSVKKFLPKEQVDALVFDVRGSKDEIVARAAEFLKKHSVVQDRKGRMVYLPNPQKHGGYGDQVLNRAEHVTGADPIQGSHQRVLHIDKAKWLAAVPETIRNAPVRVFDGNEVIYFRSYKGVVHQVTTSAEGVIINQTTYNSGLISQYPNQSHPKRLGDDAFVELLPKPSDDR
jgi:hypothetical protein